MATICSGLQMNNRFTSKIREESFILLSNKYKKKILHIICYVKEKKNRLSNLIFIYIAIVLHLLFLPHSMLKLKSPGKKCYFNLWHRTKHEKSKYPLKCYFKVKEKRDNFHSVYKLWLYENLYPSSSINCLICVIVELKNLLNIQN